MSKIPKTFRLSEQAVNHLEMIVQQTGSSDTAVVEMALAHFAKVMQAQVESKPVLSDDAIDAAWEMGFPVEERVISPAPKLGRKRHKPKHKNGL